MCSSCEDRCMYEKETLCICLFPVLTGYGLNNFGFPDIEWVQRSYHHYPVDRAHIFDRHVSRETFPGKSKFIRNIQSRFLDFLFICLMEYLDIVSNQYWETMENGDKRVIRTVFCPFTVGKCGSNIVNIVLEVNGYIVTAYPVN